MGEVVRWQQTVVLYPLGAPADPRAHLVVRPSPEALAMVSWAGQEKG